MKWRREGIKEEETAMAGRERSEERERKERTLTSGDCEVVNFTRSRVKTKSKFTNLMKMI